MRRFVKGEKALHYFHILAIHTGGNGAVWVDLTTAIPEMRGGQRNDKWLHIPLSELEISEGKKPVPLEKARSLQVVMTVAAINERGVLFDIGGGRIYEMSWDEIRNYWGDAAVPDIRMPIYNCECAMNEERLNAYISLYKELGGDG